MHLERQFFIHSSRGLLARLHRFLLLGVPHGFGGLLAVQRLVLSCFLDHRGNCWELLVFRPALILGLGERNLAGRPLEAPRLPHARRRDVLGLSCAHRVEITLDIASLGTRLNVTLVAPLEGIHLSLRSDFLHLLARGGLTSLIGLRSCIGSLLLQVVLLEIHQRRRTRSNPLVHKLMRLLLCPQLLRFIQLLADLLSAPQTLRLLQRKPIIIRGTRRVNFLCLI